MRRFPDSLFGRSLVWIAILFCLVGCESTEPAHPADDGCDEPCLLSRLGVPREAQRVMVFSQSSHLDWDWLQTFEGYFQSLVEPIFGAARDLLASQPFSYYSICEVDFLKRYLEAHPEQKEDWISFANEGRLRLVGGGRTSPDVLLPSGEAILRDFWAGHEEALHLLGVEAHQKYPIVAAWLPDDFGLSPNTPSLLQQAGYRYLAFSRLPGADQGAMMLGGQPPTAGSVASYLLDQHLLDFVWRAPDGREILAHYLYPTYGIGDSLDNGIGIPGTAGLDFNGMNTTEEYVNGQMQRYLDLVGAVSPTRYIFIPVGNDFQFPKPLLLFLLDRWNQTMYPATGVWAVAATFEHYMRLVDTQRSQLPVLELDGTPYWTGHYATKPRLKQLAQTSEADIRAVESLRLLSPDALASDAPWDLWQNMIPSNHHDFINGTSNDAVYQGEQLPLLEDAAARAAATKAALYQSLAERINTRGEGLPVVVFNPFGLIGQGLVSVEGAPAREDGYQVLGASGEFQPTQTIARNGQEMTLLFAAQDVPAHGYLVSHLIPGASSQPSQVTVEAQPDGGWRMSNGPIEIFIRQGEIESLKADGREILGLGGKANELSLYFDDGGLYRLGGEISSLGCKYQLTQTSSDIQTSTTLVEAGPLRAMVRLNSTINGLSFVREVSLDAQERMIHFKTIGAAPEHHTVTTRFRLGFQFASAYMGSPYSISERSVQGPWKEYYHPAQNFFVPKTAQGETPAGFSAIGPLAWKAEMAGTVEYILFRDARGERCEAYGPMSSDSLEHSIDYLIYLPSPTEIMPPLALPGYRFHQPLQAVLTSNHAGVLPASGGQFATSSDGAWVSAAGDHKGQIWLRIFRLDRGLTQVEITTGMMSVQKAFKSDLFLNRRESLQVQQGLITVPLTGDVETVVVQ